MTKLLKTSLLDNLPTVAGPEEQFQALLTDRNVRIERIVSFGHRSPDNFWYEQRQAEWVTVIQGEAVLAIEGQEDMHLFPGDSVNIPALKKHRVVWTTPQQPTVWLAVFYGD
ncbi:MAG TPA: cupin domain-containing protein [Pseudohongiella sp.]|nr:cupin domain-containing protein [Pseudohongiella sp.]